MISEKKFIHLIDFIKEQRRKEDKLYEALRSISNDLSGLFIFSEYEEKLLNVLADAISEKEAYIVYDILSWWAWDCNFGKDRPYIYDEKNEKLLYDLKTEKDLYKYLKEVIENDK